MAAFDRVIGKKTEPLDADWLDERVAAHSGVSIDVGTGEGKYILDAGRAEPERLCIGIDAVADNLVKSARSAAANPKKAGLPNVLFVRGAAERLPGPFEALADRLSVHYPWGSLMRIVSEPALDHLKCLRAVCKTGAEVSILLNYSVFEDRDYLERLGMADIVDPAENPALIETYSAAGFKVSERHLIHGDPPVRTSWGRHLVRGSARATLVITATAVA